MMTERQAWDHGFEHGARLRAEAESERQWRSIGRAARGVGARRRLASMTRVAAANLARLADTLDGGRRAVST